MKGLVGGKWVLAALSIVLLLAGGCGKKELVKSTDTAPGAGISAPAPVEKPEQIVSEPLKPGPQTAMAEAAAGVAATPEKPSPFPDIPFDPAKPFYPGHTEAAWAETRRDHFVLR